ncbi:hypothetical protein GPECTOR_1g525 [Gonium pectorale]|uniref:Uncharacterized protein n=1 Tax=Gonium pectorale TaxID=33097 RepID=A0A150H3G1_GONPE|nr:hypothetical protein GPECTOR_1g525 [Gonium pectorale]|eukprot:KXZ56584.1 hypothetical protein GPECTOR_1g525 [Gonium pectorale]
MTLPPARWGSGGVWQLVNRTVDSGLAAWPSFGGDTAAAVLSLLELMQPGFLQPLAPEYPLPLSPQPSVAPALAAGYIARLERLLRVAATAATAVTATAGDGADGAQVAAAAAAPLLRRYFGAFSRHASLWAYGKPRQAAALISTGAKLLRRVAAAAAAAPPPPTGVPVDLLAELTRFAVDPENLVSGLLAWLHSFAAACRGQDHSAAGRYACWWRRAEALEAWQGLGAGAPWPYAGPQAPGARSAGGGEGDGAAGSAGASGTSHTAETPLAPLVRFSGLATFALCRWLPAMARAAVGCHELALAYDGAADGADATADAAVAAAAALCRVIYGWSCILATAQLAAAGSSSSGYVVDAAGDAADGSASHRPPHRGAPSEAASWRRLLVQELELPCLILSHVRCMAACRRRGSGVDAGGEAAVTADGARDLMQLLSLLAAALPAEVRAVLTAPLAAHNAPPPRGLLSGATVLEALALLLGRRGREVFAEPLRYLWGVCEGSVCVLLR